MLLLWLSCLSSFGWKHLQSSCTFYLAHSHKLTVMHQHDMLIQLQRIFCFFFPCWSWFPGWLLPWPVSKCAHLLKGYTAAHTLLSAPAHGMQQGYGLKCMEISCCRCYLSRRSECLCACLQLDVEGGNGLQQPPCEGEISPELELSRSCCPLHAALKNHQKILMK